MTTTDVAALEREVLLDQIDPPAEQHRAELEPVELGRLADSLAELGLLEAIGLRATETGDRYEIIWGWRRFNAAQLLRWTRIRARVFPSTYDAERARAAENEFRQDLNPIERAQVCARWIAGGQPAVEVARRWRVSPETIHAWVSLLELPADLRDALSRGELSAGVARALASVDFGDYRKGLVDEAIRQGATVRVVAAWAALYHADRERIITNTITVNEIVQKASTYRVMTLCEAGAEEIPLEDSRTIRVCRECYQTLMAAFQDALTAQQSTPK